MALNVSLNQFILLRKKYLSLVLNSETMTIFYVKKCADTFKSIFINIAYVIFGLFAKNIYSWSIRIHIMCNKIKSFYGILAKIALQTELTCPNIILKFH